MGRKITITAIAAVCMLLCVSCLSASRKKEAKARYTLGVSYLNGDKIQSAYVEFQRALAIYPDDKETHNALGIVFIRLSEPNLAREHFQAAVDLDGDYSEAYNNLCYIFYEQAMYEEAVKSCLSALANKVYETPEKAFYNMGRAYYRLGKYDDAVKAFEDANRRMPGQPQVYYALSLVYNAKENYGKAAQTMTSAIDSDTRFRGDRDKAEAVFQKLSETPENQKDAMDYLEILRY